MLSPGRRVLVVMLVILPTFACLAGACGGSGTPPTRQPAEPKAPVVALDAGSIVTTTTIADAALERGSQEDAAVAAVIDAGPFGWLPAITEDGHKVAFAKTEVTGPQITPYFAVATKDVAHDRAGPLYVIHGGEDPEKPGHDERAAAALRALGRDKWRTLTQYDVQEDPNAPERQGGVGSPFRANMATGEGLTVRYVEPLLTVRDEQGHELFHRTMQTYSRLGGAMCKGCAECPPWLAYLVDVHGDRAKRVLLLEIGYRGGTDTCWEPPPVTHAITF